MAARLTATDLANAMSADVLVQIFDDDKDGTADTGPIDFTLDRAHAEVDGWLVTVNNLPLSVDDDRLARHAELSFALSFGYERHVEYVRAKTHEKYYERAVALMQRIVAGKQRLPDQTTPPLNVGGMVYDNGPRNWIDSANGESRSGDF